MTGIVKSPLQTAVVEGIYNDILTKNAAYYYFLGKTSPWTEDEGATPGIDGVISGNGVVAPEPNSTFRYELATRNATITYKLIKPSDVAYVIPRYNWEQNTIYDMYDDSYSTLNPAQSGADRIEDARYYVLTSLNNVYKCISNNYDSVSTEQPSGTDSEEFTTADGYVWQFMYNVPVALQNKFYTARYIPVMTSLRNRFYENGAIGNVAVQEPGSGYTTNVSLAVSGDGFLENNPYSVDEDCIVVSPGAGYKSSAVVTSATWLTGTATINSTGHGFNNGDIVTIRGIIPVGYNGDYTVGGAAADSFTVPIVSNPGLYTSDGSISAKILTFSSPLWGAFPTQSTGYTLVTTGALTSVKCDPQIAEAQTVYGYGYDNTATITVLPPIIHDAVWAASTSFTVDDVVKANDNFYRVDAIEKITQSLTWATDVATVTTTTDHGFENEMSIVVAGVTPAAYNGTFIITTTGPATFTYALVVGDPGAATVQGTATTTSGTTNGTLPIHTTGTIIFGTAKLTFIAAQARVNFTLTKTEAIMTPIVIGGQITGVTIDNGGVGYTYCNIIPQDTPPNSTAILVADIAIGNVDTLQADVELSAMNNRNGAISYVKMEYDNLTGYKTGYGYGVDTTVEITGDGTGATAVPVIVNGSIVAINLTNHGTGYKREAIVTILPERIVGGTDVGAKARAILSLSGGHGSNAIHEFNSNTILFYSVLSDERIHKLQNLNDYRQFGVIKNPRRHQSTARLSATSATACWLITATSDINVLNFLKDDDLSQGDEVYKVVIINGDKMVLQSFSQTIPTTTDFLNITGARAGNTFSVASITNPEVDKFTGDILFIDNKLPFVVTQDQMIAFRTTVGF